MRQLILNRIHTLLLTASPKTMRWEDCAKYMYVSILKGTLNTKAGRKAVKELVLADVPLDILDDIMLLDLYEYIVKRHNVCM